jgi:hypothetical protein
MKENNRIEKKDLNKYFEIFLKPTREWRSSVDALITISTVTLLRGLSAIAHARAPTQIYW